MNEHPLEVRRRVAQAAVDKFDGKPLDWVNYDCARITLFVLRQFGWKPRAGAAGRYRTARGAVRHLQSLGHSGLEAALDQMGLDRIAPAAALPGDIVALPGEDVAGVAMPALMIALGRGRVLGFLQGRCGVLQPSHWVTAWRTGPCPRR